MTIFLLRISFVMACRRKKCSMFSWIISEKNVMWKLLITGSGISVLTVGAVLLLLLAKKNGTGKIFEVYFDKTLNAYMNAFLSGSIDRESCYKCPFAKNERVGDITLADYWGVKRFHSEINCRQGVSLVLINTDKGFEMFNRLQGRFELIESKLEWAASENPNLSHPTPRPKGRGEAFKKAFTNPEVYIKQNSDEQHFRKAVKFTLKRFVKSTPWLYKILVKLK